MSLEEMVNQLPENHKARTEYRMLKLQVERQQEEIFRIGNER